MYIKKGVPYNIVSDDNYTGNSFITMADVIVSDIILEAIFSKETRVNIKGLETMPESRKLCEDVLDNLREDTILYDTDKIIEIDSIYSSALQSLEREYSVYEVSMLGVSYIPEDYGSSFTVIKMVTYENIDGNELHQLHYILPIFSNDVVLAKNINFALHISGDGQAEFIELPMIESGDTYVLDSRRLVDICIASKAYSLHFTNLIQHNKLFVLPVEEFATQLARLGIVNFIPAQGLGIYFDEQNRTLLGNLTSNKIILDKFDPEMINASSEKIVMYDNRLYAPKFEDQTLPITLEIFDAGQVSYAGHYMDDNFIEVIDERARQREYAEADTSEKVGRAVEKAKRIPRQIIEKGKKIMSSLRRAIVEYRKAKDDDLREKLINDEFIPVIDNGMQWLIGGATTFGIYFLVVANPVIALLGGGVARELKKIHDAKVRTRVMRMIKDELEIIDEKINDAKSSDDRKQKYALMRIKQSLEAKLTYVTRKRKLA